MNLQKTGKWRNIHMGDVKTERQIDKVLEVGASCQKIE